MGKFDPQSDSWIHIVYAEHLRKHDVRQDKEQEVSVCVYGYVCVPVGICACERVCVYVYACVYEGLCVCLVYVRVFVCMGMRARRWVCWHVCMCEPVY